MSFKLGRRLFLGGAATAVALPMMESFLPIRRAGADGPNMNPRRAVFFFVPNGMNGTSANAFRPATTGAGSDWALSPMLSPLAALKSQTLFLSGIHNRPASCCWNANAGGGDHARGTGSFLTATRCRKSDTDIYNGISIDQVIANHVGAETRFPSMELGTTGGSSAGGCDSGYSCAYSRNISWSNPTTPLPKSVSPLQVFERMFGGLVSEESREAAARRRAYRSSVLDYVIDDAERLSQRLSRGDRAKLDEYLTSVREIERRANSIAGSRSCTGPVPPERNPDYPLVVTTMLDLIALSFQCDQTRVVSFMMGNGGHYGPHEWLTVDGSPITDAHHELSHHQNSASTLRKLETIGRWEVEQLAYLGERLSEIQDPTGESILDSTAIYFSSEIEDGNRHNHEELPTIMLGGFCGDIQTDRHIDVDGQPVADLFISLARGFGVSIDRFGEEGTGAMAGLGPLSSL